MLTVAALSAIIPVTGSYAQTDDDMMMTMDSSLEGIITIGGLFPLTGDASSIGTDAREAALLAVKDYNAYLAEQGAQWTLEMLVEDTGTNPVIALEKFQLLYARGVTAVVGPFGSAQVQNIKGYADTNDLLVMSYGSTSPALAIAGDSVYRTVPDDNNQGKVLGKLLEDRGIDAVVPIWRGEIYGDGLRDAAVADFESRGGFAHEGVRYNPDSPELSLEVSALADAVQEMVDQYGTDGVAVLIISFDESLPIVQAASQYDVLADVWWVGAESVAEQDHFVSDSISAEFAGAVDFTAVQILISPGAMYDDVNSRLSELLGAVPNTFSYPAYDAVWVIAQSIGKTGSADAAEIKTVLRDVAAAHEGSVSSNELNDAGDLALANYNIWEIVDGAWAVTGEYSAADDSLTMHATDDMMMMAPESDLSGEVDVGVLYPLTGRLSSKGAENLAGTQLGVEDFNAFLREMNAGWEMVISVEDSETDPNAALEKAQALHARGVSIIIGPETSSSTTQVKPYADTNDMMLISCCSTAPSLAIAGDSVYRLVPDDSKQGVAVGNLLDSNGIEAVVPVWRGDAYGDGLRDAAKADFESRGGTFSEGIRYTPDAVEFSGEVAALADQVQMVVDEYGADQVAVFMISFDESVQIVQGSTNYDILGDVRWFGSESLTKGTPLINDRIAREFVNTVQFTSMQIAENRGEVYERVTNHILDTYGNLPTTFVYQAYDAAWLVGLSILQAGSSDPAAVKSVFHDVAADYSGALGATTLNEAGDLAAADYAIWSISGDTWVETGKYSLLDDAITMMEMADTAMGAVMVDGTEIAPPFTITGGDVSAMFTNPQENTLVIDMDTTESGSLTITLPRALIDSKLADEADDSFFVLVDGEEADYLETESSADSRTIQVEFTGGSERIEVIGTWAAVPEFGAIAALVLAAAIISIVVITARSRLSIIPRNF